MDPMAIQEWTSCEVEEFKALIAKIRNEKSCDTMEALAKRFPAKTMQQLSDQYVEVFVEMLCDDIDDEPSSDDAIIDLNDWYKLLEGDTHDLLLRPSVETPLNQPSKLLVVEAEGNQMKMQKSHCKSTDKRRRFWTAEEHRQFLRGVQRLGRGAWKAISRYFVPSKTPVQLASHAQKFFKRMKQNEMYDKRQRYSIDDVKLVNHDLRIPPPIPTEDMDFLDDLAQGMPSFGLAGYSPTKLERQMALSNHILESLRWEVSSTPSPIEQGSVLLDQTGEINIENMNHPSRRKRTNRSRKNNKRVFPGALTARTPPEVLPSGQASNSATNFTSEMAPNNQYNLHPTMPPF